VSFLLLAAAAAGVCALPEPAAAPDPAAAQAYLEVGDAETAAHSTETALLAYQEAARFDPSNARAREAYLLACTRGSPAKMLDEGIDRMDAGDRAGAIAIFERLRAGRPDPAAALYEGIIKYEEGDDEAARPLLVEAQAGSVSGARARYFLALIELRDGRGDDAAALFAQVVANAQGTLAERAELLRSTALRSGRGVISFSAESGYDSNITFAPDVEPSCVPGTSGSTCVPPRADGDGAAGVALSLRPLGLSGPYLRGTAFYRKEMQSRDQDLGVFSGQLGWRLGRGETYAFGDYGYGATLLGGSPYLLAHRLRAGGRWSVGHTALSVVYAARFGSYQAAGTTDFSGVLQTVDPGIAFNFGLASSVYFGFHLGRDYARLAKTSSWRVGPRAAARFALRPTLRASAEAGFTSRVFDGVSQSAPPTTQPQADQSVYFGGALEKDVERVTLRAAAGYQINSSNTPGFSYSRATFTVGASYALGLF
jgi:tetratricopeptide (TPR) repeat protein